MIINLMTWSPQICFIAIALLYPLRIHPRGFYISRAYACALLFPALVLAFNNLKLTIVDRVIISKIFPIPMTPISWGQQLFPSNSLIIFFTIISLLILILFLPKINYTENISLISAYFSIISLISSIADHLLKSAIFSIATVTLTYICLQQNKSDESHIINDFIIQRICDFLCFISLVIMIPATNIQPFNSDIIASNNIPAMLYVFSFIIRIICSSYALTNSASILNNSINPIKAIRWIVINIGSMIIIYPFSITFTSLNSMIIISAAIIIGFTLAALSRREPFYILASIAIISSIFGYQAIAIGLIIAAILFCPIIFLTIPSREPAQKTKFSGKIDRYLITFSKAFSNIINIIYSGFFLYHLPRIILSIIQFPLRPFHNGNTQRSLIFTIAMLVSYLLLWWRQ